MSYTTKRKVMNSSVYLVIALVTVAVLLVSAVTAAGMRSKKPSPQLTDAPQPSHFQSTPSRSSPTKAPTPSPDSGTPTPSPSPSKDKPVIDPIVDPQYYLPAQGAVFKSYSMDLPVFSLTMNDYRAHTGVDISAEIGSAVVSMADGRISNVWSDPLMGMCISVDHGEGLVSHYKNLASELPEGIAIGSEVKAGQLIASVGDSSLVELAETDHLHFELTKNGAHLDPMEYLNKQAE